LGNEVVEKVGGSVGRETLGADVGDAVAVGIRAAGARVVDEVGSQRIGRAEAGAFAEEDDGDAGTEELADLVLQGDAGEGDDGEGGDAQPDFRESGEKRAKGRRDLAVGGEGAQAVGEDQGDVVVSWLVLFECLAGGIVEAAAEVGAEEVGRAVGGGGAEVKDGVIEQGEVGFESGGVEGLVDGVAGEGVGELEVEQGAGGEGAAGAAEGDARGGEGAEAVVGVRVRGRRWEGGVHGGH